MPQNSSFLWKGQCFIRKRVTMSCPCQNIVWKMPTHSIFHTSLSPERAQSRVSIWLTQCDRQEMISYSKGSQTIDNGSVPHKRWATGFTVHHRRWGQASERSFICAYSCSPLLLRLPELCLLSDEWQHQIFTEAWTLLVVCCLWESNVIIEIKCRIYVTFLDH